MIRRPTAVLLAALTLTSASMMITAVDTAQAAGWVRKVANVLIVPGRSVGAIALGRPVPAWFYNQMGRPSIVTKAGAQVNTGFISWGGVPNSGIAGLLAVSLNDGAGRENVSEIILSTIEQDLRQWPVFKTKEGIQLESPFAWVRRAYPDGKETQGGMDVEKWWELPARGISFGISDGEVIEINVYPPGRRR
ncbi:hypothetical protein D3C72_1247310 [compost metagenome]